MNSDTFKTMLPESHQLPETLIWLAIFLLAGILAGIISEFIVKHISVSWASKTKWLIDDFLVGAFKGLLLPFFIVTSFYLSTYFIPDLHSIQIVSNKICFSIAAFIITLFIARFLSKVIKHFSSTAEVPLPSTLLSNLSSVIIFIIGTLVTLQTFGISITPILTTLGIGGLAVALALQDTLANLFSGLYILLSKQVHVGDLVKLDSGSEGYIHDITWRNTIIKTMSNNAIIIPNNKLSAAIITNYSRPTKEYTFTMDVGISYDSDLAAVEKITRDTVRDVLATTPGGVQEFDPIVRYHTFGESSINMTIVIRGVEFVSQFEIKNECIKKLHQRYREAGIVIPYPTQTIQLQKECGAS